MKMSIEIPTKVNVFCAKCSTRSPQKTPTRVLTVRPNGITDKTIFFLIASVAKWLPTDTTYSEIISCVPLPTINCWESRSGLLIPTSLLTGQNPGVFKFGSAKSLPIPI